MAACSPSRCWRCGRSSPGLRRESLCRGCLRRVRRCRTGLLLLRRFYSSYGSRSCLGFFWCKLAGLDVFGGYFLALFHFHAEELADVVIELCAEDENHVADIEEHQR